MDMLGSRSPGRTRAWPGSGDRKISRACCHPRAPVRASVGVMTTMGESVELSGVRGAESDADALVLRLFRDEATRLVQMARWFVDDRTAAEDLVQEAFIKLSTSLHRIRDPDRAAPYLRAIVINLARDHNRRGLVSLRHRPPAVLPERSAEDHATDHAASRAVVAPCGSCPGGSATAWCCATTSTCPSRRSPRRSGCPRTR